MAHITYDRTKPFGRMTADLVTAVRAARDNAERLVAAMDAINAGGGGSGALEADTTEGAANFGVPDGRGPDFYSAVSAIRDDLAAVRAGPLADLDLGA